MNQIRLIAVLLVLLATSACGTIRLATDVAVCVGHPDACN
jgi:hypothetical protein